MCTARFTVVAFLRLVSVTGFDEAFKHRTETEQNETDGDRGSSLPSTEEVEEVAEEASDMVDFRGEVGVRVGVGVGVGGTHSPPPSPPVWHTYTLTATHIWSTLTHIWSTLTHY